MTWLPNPTTSEDPWDTDLDARLDQLQTHIVALEAQGPPSPGSEFIDPSQAPYNCDMTGVTKSGGNGTARNGSDSTHGMLKAVYDAFTTGKTLWIPPGTIDMRKDDGTPALIWIDFSVKQRRVVIRGCGSEGVTVLKWPTQLGTVTDPTDVVLGGDPSGRVANIAIDPYNANNTNSSLEISDLTLKGPGTYGDIDDPERRGDGWAIAMGGRTRVYRVEANGWHAAACFRMRGPSHNIDHNTIRDCKFDFNFGGLYWSYYWPVSGANSGDGDHVIENTSLSNCTKAARMVDPAAIVFDSKIASCHGGFTCFGWYGEYGPQGSQSLTAKGTETVARDAAGVVTIDTKNNSTAATWGPFDRSAADPLYKPWNAGTNGACFGFIPGDVVDLNTVAAAGHAAGTLAAVSSCVGRVTAQVGTVLTIKMESPVVGSAFSALGVTAGGITSHYNNPIMLSYNVEYDGTYEGCGVSNIFAPNRMVRGFGTTSQLPFHSLMSVDNNKGGDNAYSSIPILSLNRVGSTGITTGKVPAGTAMQVDDNWFINTPTAGTYQDDNPPSSAWKKQAGRVRGVHRILSVTDNTDGGTTLTFTFQQTGTLGDKNLGDGTTTSWDPTGHPQHGSAGGAGRVAGFVVQFLQQNEGPTFDCTAHPPDQQDDGGPLAAIELVMQHMESSRFHMLQGVGFYPRQMTGTTDSSTIPSRSLCVAGDREMPITHTGAACAAGDIVEFTGRDDVRPFQGGTCAGVALWSRANGDFILYMRKGILRSENGYDAQGVKSTVAFTQGDLIYADPTNHGRATNLAGAGGAGTRAIIGRATSNSTGPVGGIYTTALRVEIRNANP